MTYKAEKLLFVAGRDGIGNRLLSLEKACRLAALHDFSIYIDWSDSIFSLSQDEFYRLFRVDHVNHTTNVVLSNFIKHYPRKLKFFDANFLEKLTSNQGHWTWLLSKIFDRYRDAFYSDSGKFLFRNGENLNELCHQYDCLLFYSSIPSREPERFRHLAFCENEIERLLIEFGVNDDIDIGIHIRQTDKVSKDLDRAYDCLFKAIDKFDGIPLVHVATDNVKVLEEFRSRFSSRSHIQSLPIRRTTLPLHLSADTKSDKTAALNSALADIHCLSKSQQFYFQSNSSFSRVAVAMQRQGIACPWDKSILAL